MYHVYYTCSKFPSNSVDLLRNAVLSVLKDDGYKIKSVNAEKVLRAGEKVLEWISDADHKWLF